MKSSKRSGTAAKKKGATMPKKGNTLEDDVLEQDGFTFVNEDSSTGQTSTDSEQEVDDEAKLGE